MESLFGKTLKTLPNENSTNRTINPGRSPDHTIALPTTTTMTKIANPRSIKCDSPLESQDRGDIESDDDDNNNNNNNDDDKNNNT